MTCPTPHKLKYATRRAAKRARRRAHAGDGRLRAYRCGCGWFHLGHIPAGAVARSRAEHFDGVKPEPLPATRRPSPKLVPPLQPDPRRPVTPVVVPAHEFFATRLCEHPRCGREQPCPRHERRAA